MVEDKDATPEQKTIRELNSGVYVFKAAKLRAVLSELRSDNVQGEYYLTDAPVLMHLRDVAVPVRLQTKQIGDALVTAARTRPKYIGGARAQYE